MKRVKFGVFGNFLENPLRKLSEILHADVSWSLSELIRLQSQFVDFSYFGAILTEWHGSNLGVSRHFGRAVWIFLIVVPLWLKLTMCEVSGHHLEDVGWRLITDALCRVLSSFYNNKQRYLSSGTVCKVLENISSTGHCGQSIPNTAPMNMCSFFLFSCQVSLIELIAIGVQCIFAASRKNSS